MTEHARANRTPGIHRDEADGDALRVVTHDGHTIDIDLSPLRKWPERVLRELLEQHARRGQ